MRILAAFIILFSLSDVFADCVQDFRELHNQKDVKLVKDRTIELINKRQLKYLIDPELKVVDDYMNLTGFSFDGDNGLSVTTEQYLNRLTDSGMGYRISITDGGEFSEVRYYIRTRENQRSLSYPVLFRVQKGPVRVSEYICEQH